MARVSLGCAFHLIINSLLSFLALNSYKVFIKYFFAYITSVNTAKKIVAIYRASDLGISTKYVLKQDMTANIQSLLYLENYLCKVTKNINSIYIFDSAQLEGFTEHYTLDHLIIATTKLPSKK